MNTAIVWFRHDLRLHDNPALSAAAAQSAIIPVFIWSPDDEGEAAAGAAGRWWLAQSLRSLDAALRERGGRLIVRCGRAAEVLPALIRECGATHVHWNRRYEPSIVARDTQLKNMLQERGVAVESHNGALLFEPWEISTQEGRPFRVYTPFSKACFHNAARLRDVLPSAQVRWPSKWPVSLSVDDLQLEPKVDWAAGIRESWQPGEAGARAALDRFLTTAVTTYATDRDTPGIVGTSRLSPHLHFGEISPNEVWSAVRKGTFEQESKSHSPGGRRRTSVQGNDHAQPAPGEGAEKYLKELLWREFAHHLLYHFPHTVTQPLDQRFAAFPWKSDARRLRAWQRGRTGFPIIDAGMRELWATGWMHNRVRMIVASFLVKDLLISWRDGAAWFWDTLVDADLANNTLGWQWVAGCGADAAPFFRIFNPILQGKKFDPDGMYVRRWVPELARLPDKYLHDPSTAPPFVLEEAGVRIGHTYPTVVVDHSAARLAALAAYEHVKRAN